MDVFNFLLLYWYQYISAGFSQVKLVVRCILRCQELNIIFMPIPTINKYYHTYLMMYGSLVIILNSYVWR